MKETVIFTIVLVAAVATGIYLVRKPKPELISEEQALRTLERATQALAAAKAEVERCKNDTNLNYNPSLKQFAIKEREKMRDIMQNVYDGALKAVEAVRAQRK